MTKETKYISTLVFLVLLSAVFYFTVRGQNNVAIGSATSGSPASFATSSLDAVGTTASTLVASGTCTARVVSTGGASAVMLTFNDKYVPTGNFGLWQAASTTVAYDSGLYGCGALKAYSFIAQSITVADTQ